MEEQVHIGTSLYPQRKALTLRQLLENVSYLYADTDAYIYRKKVQGADYHVTYRELGRDVKAFAAVLSRELGKSKQPRIAIIGENSYPWVISYNAAVSYIGVAVPLDPQLPTAEALDLIKRSQAEILCFSPKQNDLAAAVAKADTNVKVLLSFAVEDAEIAELQGKIKNEKLLCFWNLLKEGQNLDAREQATYLNYTPAANDLASIIFTSGTTSDSKGVMLSHLNIASNAHSCAETYNVKVGDRALSVLPLHHTFENTVGMFTFWYLGLSICINDGLRYIAKNMQHWRIGIMMVVPAIVENIHNQIMRAVRKQNLEKRLQRAFRLVKFFSFFKQDHRHRIFKSVIEQLGGNLHLFVCGGAPLNPQVCEFFNLMGINCVPGYGLSEASPVLACCNQKKVIPSSVGWPLPGVSLQIDQSDLSDDGNGHEVGEVLAMGENIMMGYLDAEDLTKEALTDNGWLRTGDLGYFDKEGALHLTGRKKSMLVLSNGKKAFPEEIEGLLKDIPAVKEAFVWDMPSQRGNVMICAKIQIDSKNEQIAHLSDDEEISHFLAQAVNKINAKMPVYKAINAFIWSEEPLCMTTSLKVKRPAERARITQDLKNKGLTIHEANGQRVPGLTDIQFQPRDI